MKIALALSLSLLAAPALAGGAFAPPAKYQGKPDMPVHIIAVPVMELQKRCENNAFPIRMMYGCARMYHSPRRCVIFIPDKSFPNWAWPEGGTLVVKPGDILKHELGHCRGWPSNHPR